MRTLVTTGFVALALAGCSDDAGGSPTTATPTGSSGSPTSTSTGAGTTTDTPGTSTGMEQTSTTAADTTSADSSSGSEGSSGMVEFEMSSPAFEEGGLFPGTMHINGGNVHPQLDWVGAPVDTMSFGVFFHDETINFEHSAIWNIPADATGLPEDVDQDPMPANVPGAVQCRNWTNQFGYGGPGSPANFYVFTLYALDTADLSGEIDQDSSRVEVNAALQAHALAEVTLSGQSNGP